MNRLSVASVLLAALFACGGGVPPASGGKDPGHGPDAVDIATTTPDDEIGGRDADSNASIDTTLSASQAKTGDVVTVTCSGTGFDPAKAKFTVKAAVAAQPGDIAEGGPGIPETLPDAFEPPPATYPPDLTVPDGVIVMGGTVRFTKPGAWAVSCYADDAQIVDPQPADITIDPGLPVKVDTEVCVKDRSKNPPVDVCSKDAVAMKAGEIATVTCTAWDAYQNPVDVDVPTFTLIPPDGANVSGTSVTMTKAGKVSVACTAAAGTVVDDSPVVVTVSPNVPTKILTTVDPNAIVAGDGKTPGTFGEVSCSVTDDWGNPVADFPFVLFLPPRLNLTNGTHVSSFTADRYEVKCVPQGIDWKYFQITGAIVTVAHADPASMVVKLVPDKSLYSVGESVAATVVAKDAYDNPIPEASLVPSEIAPMGAFPADGIVVDATNSTPAPGGASYVEEILNLNAEGIYDATFRLAQKPTLYTDRTLRVSAGTGPILTVLSPPRGATISTKPSVPVRGKASCGVQAITSLTVVTNGSLPDQVMNLDSDGNFKYTIAGSDVKPGLNVYTVEVTCEDGSKFETTRGFYYSQKYYDMDNEDKRWVGDGARAFLGSQFFDDGVHDHSDPNDLATIVEIILANLNIGSLIPSPVASAGPYKVYLQNIRYDAPTVRINLTTDGIVLYITIPNLSIGVALVGKCSFLGIDFCPDFTGSVAIQKIDATAKLTLTFDPATHLIHATMDKVQVALTGIDIHIDGILGWLFDWLINLVANGFKTQIETALEQQIGSMIGPLLDSLFSKFDITQSFQIPSLLGSPPTTITLRARPAEFKIQPNGATVGLDAAIIGANKITHSVLGSYGRSSCLNLKPGGGVFDLKRIWELEVAAADDLLNEALFTVWRAAVLNLSLTADQLLGLGLDPTTLPVQNLGINLDFYLPPILTDCNIPGNPSACTTTIPPACPGRRVVQAQVGDLYADITFTFGSTPLEVQAFLELAATAEIDLVNDAGVNKIGLTIKSLDTFALDIVDVRQWIPDDPYCAQDNQFNCPGHFEEADPNLKAALLSLLQSQLIDTLAGSITGKSLATIAIPTFDISSLGQGMIPPGVTLNIAVDTLYGENGFTGGGAHLQ